MRKSLMSLTIVMVMLIVSSSAFAFGLHLPGKKKAVSSAVSLDDTMKSQDELVSTYNKALGLNIDANARLAEALGDKEEAEKYKVAGQELKKGNCNSDSLNKAIAITEESNSASEDRLNSGKALSAESKKKVGESMILMAQSVICYKQAAEKSKSCLDNAQSVVKSAPMSEKISVKKKLDPILSIAPKMPKSLVNAGKTLKNLVSYAKNNGIKVPKKATEALGEL